MRQPTLNNLWEGAASFRSEDPRFVAMTANLEQGQHSSNGKLSLDHLEDGRIIAAYRHTSTPSQTKSIRICYSDDGLTFRDNSTPPHVIENGWGRGVGDPSIFVFKIQNKEHVFIVYEADARATHPTVLVNIGMMWSEDQGKTWKQHGVPLTESKDIPTWGKTKFRGTSVPTAVVHLDRRHIWIYWSGLYEENPNHAEVGAGYIGIVRPGTHDSLSLDDGGVLEQRSDGFFQFTIDPPQKSEPVIKRGPFAWCSGAVDAAGNIVLDDDGLYYTAFRAGFTSEGNPDDFFSAGLARTSGMTSFEKHPDRILMPFRSGVGGGISYPWLFRHKGSWYLYFVCDHVAGPVPNPNEKHFRLQLQWNPQ